MMISTSASGTERTDTIPLSMHAQWEPKLARYVEKERKQPPTKCSRERRDCTMLADMDYAIPEGFRGE